MFKIFFLVLILTGCLCNIININNDGGCGCKPCQPSNPTPPTTPTVGQYNYATFYDLGYFNNAFQRDLFNAMVNRTPELKGHISPIPYLTNVQMLSVTDQCIYDTTISTFNILKYARASSSFVKIASVTNKNDLFIVASNMPLIAGDALSTVFCDVYFPNCSSAGICGKGNLTAIAQQSIQNNDAPVVFKYYESSPLITDFALMFKVELTKLGVKNVTLSTIEPTVEAAQAFAITMGTTNPASTIYLFLNPGFTNEQCGIANAPFPYKINLQEYHYPTPDYGYPICPSNFRLKALLTDTIAQLTSDFTICKIRAKYGECRITSAYYPLFEINPNDNCNFWPDMPNCVLPTGKKSDKENLSSVKLEKTLHQ